MTLPVPLSIRVGDTNVSEEAQSVGFRVEAIGGVKSITFRLARPLTSFDPNLAAFSRVTLYDTRTADAVADGRISDTGRGVSSADGQQWEVTAFGPSQHVYDETVPLIYIDRSLQDGWRQVERLVARGTVTQSQKPNNTSDSAPECMVLQFAPNVTMAANDRVVNRYERLRETGQRLASFGYSWDASPTDAAILIQGVSRTDGGTGEAAASNSFNTAGGSNSGVYPTDILASTRNTLDLRIVSTGAGFMVAGTSDLYWGAFNSLWVRAMTLNKNGTDQTSGLSNAYVVAYRVVNDLLARVLDQFDGPGANVDTSASFQIEQLAYPDGVTSGQVLDDMMALEPSMRWTTGPANSAGKYSFSWEPWPTTVRYEVTLDDGGDFPVSAQELYNQVLVRWRDSRGRVRSTTRTLACKLLDDAGVTRKAVIDVGDEIASLTSAQRLGDNFLLEHNVPANAGTLVISRPIMDLALGRMVQPYEIKAGQLIRVKGVESYPDSLNASSNDGMTVFRIWAGTYSSDTHAMSVELDTYSRTTANALARLAKRRIRKR